MGTDGSVLDPLERNGVPGFFRVAPDDSASRRAALAVGALGRLLSRLRSECLHFVSRFVRPEQE
jgi:hypothetical protein